jgi:hypothetical protein
MTDFETDASDLVARWHADTQAGALRPTANEQAAMRQAVVAAIEAAPRHANGAGAHQGDARPPAHLSGHTALRQRRRWALVASLAAAAALWVSARLIGTAGGASHSQPDDPSVASGTSSEPIRSEPKPLAYSATSSAPMRTALQLANREASPEFAALAAAAAELDAALAVSPDDTELRIFRAALEARRDELAQRIRSVTE